MKKLVLMAFLVALTGLASNAAAASEVNWRFQNNAEEYDTMSLETYEIELKAAIDKEALLQSEIAAEQAKIDSLKLRLEELDTLIAQVSQEIYDILGITEQDVIDAEAEISEIRQNLQLLLGLSPDELQARKSEIDKNEARINALKAKPISYLWKIRDQIRELEDLVARVRANLPDHITSYTVELRQGNRDCLYRIANNEEVYDDATRWPELYRANKSTIDNGFERYKRYSDDPKYDRAQDIIFPGQVFDIPR